MRGIRGIALFFVVLSCGAPCSAGLAGLWLTEDEDAHVRVEPCAAEAAELCGTLVWLSDPDDEDGRPRRDVHNPDEALRERPILGLEILRIAATPDRRGVYRHGSIYDPKTGKTYRCKATPDDDGTVRLRGFVGVSLLGRTTRWRRVE